jgi:hypothetical protein
MDYYHPQIAELESSDAEEWAFPEDADHDGDHDGDTPVKQTSYEKCDFC